MQHASVCSPGTVPYLLCCAVATILVRRTCVLMAQSQNLRSDLSTAAWLRGVTLTVPANMSIVGGVLEGLLNEKVSAMDGAHTCLQV